MKKVIFEPMPGKIAVRTSNMEEYERNGIILLSNPMNETLGEVIAIYEPFNLNPDDSEMTEAYVKVGDLVVFGRHSGAKVTVERQSCVILREAEILTKVRIEEAYAPTDN